MTAMHSMHIEVSKGDFLAAQRLHRRSVSRLSMILTIAIILAVFVYVDFWRDYSAWQSVWAAGSGLLGMSVIIAWQAVSFRRKSNRIYDQWKRTFSNVECKWDERGFSIENLNSIPWNEVVMTREDDRVYLIYNTDVSFLILPKNDPNNLLMIEDVKEHIRKGRQKTQ